MPKRFVFKTETHPHLPDRYFVYDHVKGQEVKLTNLLGFTGPVQVRALVELLNQIEFAEPLDQQTLFGLPVVEADLGLNPEPGKPIIIFGLPHKDHDS